MSHDQTYSSDTQVLWTCKAPLANQTISHRTEIREVAGWRLAAITERLRKQYGWPIHVEYRGSDNIARYQFAPGTDPTRLRFPASAKFLADMLKGGAE